MVANAMFELDEFRQLIRQVRAGDEGAAMRLVQRYEPLIRREVRLRLHHPMLRRSLDSLDITQSVLASFFLRTAGGEYDLDRPDQLVGLLIQMTRNKLASAARKQFQLRRDVRRIEPTDIGLWNVATSDPPLLDSLANRELIVRMRAELTPEESRIADLRSEGHTWDSIAVQLGGTAQARRMQLARALDRVSRSLGVPNLRND